MYGNKSRFYRNEKKLSCPIEIRHNANFCGFKIFVKQKELRKSCEKAISLLKAKKNVTF